MAPVAPPEAFSITIFILLGTRGAKFVGLIYVFTIFCFFSTITEADKNGEVIIICPVEQLQDFL